MKDINGIEILIGSTVVDSDNNKYSIIKKNGDLTACSDTKLRENLIEEMADVLMYYNDVMLCYGISVDELKQSYIKKFEKNMKRW